MAFELTPLPFALDALEPHISKKTLEFHYGKHHKNYVEKLNKLITGTRYEKNYSLEDIMRASYLHEPKIYNNAAQVWNHSFMWNCLTGKPDKPSSILKSKLNEDFGSVDKFKAEFLKQAKDLFGSGWVWLVQNKSGRLQLSVLSNAENPMQRDLIPLLTCDVWEHGYYLDYQNDRGRYLENYWTLINWEFVQKNLRKPSLTRSESFRSEKPLSSNPI